MTEKQMEWRFLQAVSFERNTGSFRVTLTYVESV